MNISLEFARTLLEGDQLARNDQLEHALVLYRNLAMLASNDATERALAQARVQRVEQAIDQQGVKVVERTPIESAPSEEARAEALVNSGDLDGAIGLYQKLVDAEGDNQLLAERLQELQQRAQLTRAPELDTAPPVSETTVAVEAELAEPVLTQQHAAQARIAELVEKNWSEGLPQDPIAMLEELLQRVRSNRRSAA